MKILSFDSYISEKKSIKPLTIKQIKNLDLDDNLIEPGDSLEDEDKDGNKDRDKDIENMFKNCPSVTDIENMFKDCPTDYPKKQPKS